MAAAPAACSICVSACQSLPFSHRKSDTCRRGSFTTPLHLFLRANCKRRRRVASAGKAPSSLGPLQSPCQPANWSLRAPGHSVPNRCTSSRGAGSPDHHWYAGTGRIAGPVTPESAPRSTMPRDWLKAEWKDNRLSWSADSAIHAPDCITCADIDYQHIQ